MRRKTKGKKTRKEGMKKKATFEGIKSEGTKDRKEE